MPATVWPVLFIWSCPVHNTALVGFAAAVDFLHRNGSRTALFSRAAGELDGSLAQLEQCGAGLGAVCDWRIFHVEPAGRSLSGRRVAA